MSSPRSLRSFLLSLQVSLFLASLYRDAAARTSSADAVDGVTWTSPVPGSRFAPGDVVVARWSGHGLGYFDFTAPSFRFCVHLDVNDDIDDGEDNDGDGDGGGGEDADTDAHLSPRTTCGDSTSPVVYQIAGSYAAKLATPNISTQTNLYILIESATGTLTSPLFFLDPSLQLAHANEELDPPSSSLSLSQLPSDLEPQPQQDQPVPPSPSPNSTTPQTHPALSGSPSPNLTRTQTPQAYAVPLSLGFVGLVVIGGGGLAMYHRRTRAKSKAAQMEALEIGTSVVGEKSAGRWDLDDVPSLYDTRGYRRDDRHRNITIAVVPPPTAVRRGGWVVDRGDSDIESVESMGKRCNTKSVRWRVTNLSEEEMDYEYGYEYGYDTIPLSPAPPRTLASPTFSSSPPPLPTRTLSEAAYGLLRRPPSSFSHSYEYQDSPSRHSHSPIHYSCSPSPMSRSRQPYYHQTSLPPSQPPSPNSVLFSLSTLSTPVPDSSSVFDASSSLFDASTPAEFEASIRTSPPHSPTSVLSIISSYFDADAPLYGVESAVALRRSIDSNRSRVRRGLGRARSRQSRTSRQSQSMSMAVNAEEGEGGRDSRGGREKETEGEQEPELECEPEFRELREEEVPEE